MKKVLTIAGSDSSGGAGIQADIKTIMAHKMYAMSAITALTAQNTTGVYGIMDADPEFVAKQIECIFDDIRPDAVKIGMVSNAAILEVIAETLLRYKAENIVLDPVMVSTSGCRLLSEQAESALIGSLVPMACLITPNIPEAQVLSGMPIRSEEDMVRAAEHIQGLFPETGMNILIKGGHLTAEASDLLLWNGQTEWFRAERVDNPNTHGTGCTLSSAIACNLAAGNSLPDSIRKAKAYLTGALNAKLDLGKGSGPLDHAYIFN